MRFFTLKGHRHSLLMVLFICLVLPMNVAAQKLEVISLEDAVTDNTAWNPSTCHKLDDGRYCPVVKVEFNQPACDFEGGIFEGKKPVFKTNEYWVYMLPGARHLIIKHPNFDKIDVFFDEVNPEIIRLKEKHTYILKLKGEIKKGLESVEKGEAASMLKMAQNYENGTGAYNKNIQQALEWYGKAAEAGSVEAQEYLADVLYEGKNGFKKDEHQAVRWNEVCAKRGNEKAILRTAQLYAGMKLNQQAISWYIKYNELHPTKELQMQIAQLYDTSSPNHNKWLKIAADNGHIEAAYELATTLAPTNQQTAAIYYQKAIDAGHVMAMNEYGTFLLTGKYGFVKDEKTGTDLINQAIGKGSLEAASSQLKTSDLKLAEYVAQIPSLLQVVKEGDADAILKLILIYSAVGDNLMVNRMKLIALYNFSYKEVPIVESYDPILLKKADIQHWQTKSSPSTIDENLSGRYSNLAHLLKGDTNLARLLPLLMGKKPDVSRWSTYEENKLGGIPTGKYHTEIHPDIYDTVINDFRSICDHTRNVIDKIFSYNRTTDGVIDYFVEIYNFANILGDESCQQILLQQNGNISYDRLGVNEYSVLTSFQKQLLQQRLSRNQNMIDKKQYYSKTHKKQLITENNKISELLKGANKTESIKKGEWLRQLKEEGYFWTPKVAANAKEMSKNNKQRMAEEAKNQELKRNEVQRNKIKERGKRTGVKTFEVKGVPFNMVLVKPNPKAKYSDWNSGVNDYAPKASYYIAETEVTQELWDAVMGESSKSDILQHPKYIKDTNKWSEFETFINKLNKLTGKRFRVPTHAEWEYAAHGGALSGSPYCIDRHTAAEYRFTDYQVAQGTPNELGLYDILTGVMEFNKIPNYGWPSPNKGYSDHFGLRLALSAQ